MLSLLAPCAISLLAAPTNTPECVWCSVLRVKGVVCNLVAMVWEVCLPARIPVVKKFDRREVYGLVGDDGEGVCGLWVVAGCCG